MAKTTDGIQKGRLVDLSKGMVDVVHPALLDNAESKLIKNASLDERGTLKPSLGRVERFAQPFDLDNPCNGIYSFYPDTTTSRLIIGAGSKLYKDIPHLINRWTDQAHFEEAESVRINCDTATKPGDLTVTTPPTATFARASVAYLPDGTEATVDNPRYVDGKYTKAIMVEEGTTNLVENPSFESTTDWDTLNRTTEAGAFHGDYACKVTYNWEQNQIIAGITDGQTYTISAYGKNGQGSDTGLLLRAERSDDTSIQSWEIFWSETNWTRESLTITTPEETTQFRIYLTKRGGEADYDTNYGYIDAVQLEQKPYATSFVAKAANLLTAESASFEGGTTGDWTVSSATISVVSNGWHGSKGLKVVSSATNGRAQINITSKVAVDDTITLSARARLESGGPRNVSISIAIANVSSNSISKMVSSTEWTEISKTLTLTTLGDGVWIQLFGGEYRVDYGTVIWDGIQVEKNSYATTFTDGTRYPETLTIPTEGVLNPQEGTVEFWAWLPDGPQSYLLVVKGNPDDNNNRLFIYGTDTGSGNQSMRALIGTGSSYVVTPTISTTRKSWHYFAVRWTATALKLTIDTTTAEVARTGVCTFGDIAYIGSSLGSNQANALIDDLRISNRAKSDEEILAAYQSGQPLPVDEYTTAKMDFDSNLAISIPFIWISDKKDITAAQDTNSGKIGTKIDTPGGSSVAVLTRTSNDGTTWDDWLAVLSDNTIQSTHRAYIQVKVIGKMWEADKPSVQEIVLSYDGSPSVSELATGLTPGGQWFFDTLLSKCVMTNKLDAPKVWDGNNPVAVLAGSPPHAQFVTAHKNYLFMAGTSEGPSRLYFSEVLNLESWPVLNFIDVSPNDGDWITGLLPYDDYLVITKNRSVWHLVGSGPSDFEVRRIHDGIGCIAPRSLCRMGEVFAFVSHDGIYTSNLTSPMLISEKLKKTWQGLNQRRLSQACSAYFNHKLRVDVPNGSSTINNLRIIYDAIRQALILEEVADHASCYCRYVEAGHELLLYGHANEGQVSHADTGSSDAGQPINFEWESKHFDFGIPEHVKRWRRVFMEFAPAASDTTINVSFVVDGGNPSGSIELTIPGDKTKKVHNVRVLPSQVGVVQGHSLGFRVTQSATNGGVGIHAIILDYFVKGVRPTL